MRMVLNKLEIRGVLIVNLRGVARDVVFIFCFLAGGLLGSFIGVTVGILTLSRIG
jgi:hypothetical protein